MLCSHVSRSLVPRSLTRREPGNEAMSVHMPIGAVLAVHKVLFCHKVIYTSANSATSKEFAYTTRTRVLLGKFCQSVVSKTTSSTFSRLKQQLRTIVNIYMCLGVQNCYALLVKSTRQLCTIQLCNCYHKSMQHNISPVSIPSVLQSGLE